MSFSLSEHTKIDVGWGLVPDPTGGSLQHSPDPYLVSRVPLRGRREMGEGKEGLGDRKRGKGEWGREGKGEIGGIAPCCWGIDDPDS